MVPGALVTLTHTDEGTFRTTKTNGVGDFRFLDSKAAGPRQHKKVRGAKVGPERIPAQIAWENSLRIDLRGE